MALLRSHVSESGSPMASCQSPRVSQTLGVHGSHEWSRSVLLFTREPRRNWTGEDVHSWCFFHHRSSLGPAVRRSLHAFGERLGSLSRVLPLRALWEAGCLRSALLPCDAGLLGSQCSQSLVVKASSGIWCWKLHLLCPRVCISNGVDIFIAV